jgi:enoyl-CoA hydratase
MTYQTIIVEKRNRIALITLNRPESLNALNKILIDELSQLIDQLQTDDEVRVIILTGAGEKAFVAGADIKEFAHFTPTEGKELAHNGQKKLFDKIENSNKPFIAAINGFALGGGLELALACQLRVASFTAKMGLPEVTLGLIPGYGGTQRLTQIVGKGKATEMILTAEIISAEEAFKIGLISYLQTTSGLVPFCEKLAASIIKNSPQAISNAIKAINAGYNELNGFEKEIEFFGNCFGTEDFKEGTTAFLEKRKPKF